ncbi:MAG: ATP-binding protein [Nitrospirota bacterium]
MSFNSKIINYIFTVDKQQRIISCNKEEEKIFGKSFPEVQGLPYYEIIPRIKKDGKDIVKQVLKSSAPVFLKGYHIPCFYGHITMDIQIVPVKDKAGKITGANLLFEEKRGCPIKERLKQSQTFIDIGRIAATFAHGIRSPLNAIKGSVVYLREKYADEKRLIEFTKIIEEEIAHLDNFIAKFLSASVFDFDKGFSIVDINSLLKKIEILTSLQAQSYKIKTFYEYGKVSPVIINPFHLEHALLNVINNSIEAMSSGGTLRVKTQTEISSGTNFAMIEISDSGPGISKENNKVQPDNNKGRGLGLFITRETLKSYKGHLEVKSKRGTGTIVKLYIPTGHADGKQG